MFRKVAVLVSLLSAASIASCIDTNVGPSDPTTGEIDQDTTIVPPPTNLQITVLSNTSAQLTWTAVPGATSYIITQGTASGNETTLVQVSGATTTFSTNHLLAGSTNFFAVRTFITGLGQSAASNEVSATQTTSGVPTPTGVSVTQGVPATSRATVSWTAVPNATKYYIQMATGTTGGAFGVFTNVGTATGTATSFSKANLAPGTAFAFEVIAETVNGDSAPSAAATTATQSVLVANNPATLLTIAASPAGATESGTVGTYTTTTPHGLAVGDTVTLAGVSHLGFNGELIVAAVPSSTTFTVKDLPAGLLPSGGGTAETASKPCFNALHYGLRITTDDADSVFACSADGGLFRGDLANGRNATWSVPTGITNKHGGGFAYDTQATQAGYVADSSLGQSPNPGNYFTMDATVTPPGAAFLAPVAPLAAPFDTAKMTAFGGFFSEVGVQLGTSDPSTHVATLISGSQTAPQPSAVATVQGSVVAISGGILAGTTTSTSNNIVLAVAGTAGGGGVFRVCNLTNSGGTGVFDDISGSGATGIAADDKALMSSVLIDTSTIVSTTFLCSGSTASRAHATTLYATVKGGGQIYKSTDSGATWAVKNSGLPAGAQVLTLAMDCQGGVPTETVSSTCNDHLSLWAGTSVGLYRSRNGGDSWTLDALPGTEVRSVAVHPSTQPPLVFIGANDSNRFYHN